MGTALRLLVIMSSESAWSKMIMRELRRQGVAAEMFDPRSQSDASASAEESASSTVRPRGLFGRPRTLVQSVRALNAVAHVFRPDACICLYGGRHAVVAWLSGVRPYGVYFMGSDVTRDHPRAVKTILRRAYKSANARWANGSWLAESAERAYGVRAHPLYHGIPIPARPDVSGYPQKRFIVTRRFEPLYRNHLVIEAAAQFGLAQSDFELHFTAGGPLEPGAVALADRLLDTADRQRVHFWGGLPHQALLRLLGEGGVYVSMSNVDGTSTALLEAMVRGMVPVLSDIPANREWFAPEGRGAKGFLAASVEELSAAMRSSADVLDEWDGHAGRNHEIVARQADIETNMRNLVSYLVSTN